ncbi:MAG: phosphoribosyl-AMP cyclohydrolase [Planctomycetota bacterium]
MAGKITEAEVLEAQECWGQGIVDIGHEYMSGGDFVGRATKHIEDLYAYGDKDRPVLFKPTKCEHVQFRRTFEEALSYFVGHNFAPAGCSEDNGFAIAPYVAVYLPDPQIILEETRAIAMGNYFFVKPSGENVKVEYTFGYRRKSARSKKLIIDLHHSSIPFKH